MSEPDTYRRISYRVRPEVQRAIARHNLSQNQLARRCGLSSGHLSTLLTGRRCVGPQARASLMRILKLTFDELFEEVK